MDKLSKKFIFGALAIIIVAILIIMIFYFGATQKSVAGTITVKRSNLTEIVKSYGLVKPARNVDLAFQNGGKISSVSADVGNYVAAGQAIASLDSADLNAQLDKAQADLATQQAILNKDNIDLGNQYGNVINTLDDAFTKANDAVRNQADNLFSNGESDTPQINFLTADSQAQTDAQHGRLRARTELNAWRDELNALVGANPPDSDLYTALAESQKHLLEIQIFLTSLNSAMNEYYGANQTAIDTLKTFLSAAIGETNGATVETTGQKQTIDSQTAVIASQKANVKAYEANIENIQAQLSKTVIYAPIGGIISRQDAKVGQIVSPNAILASIISASQFQVETLVSEADVAKIKIGDDAGITLDAFGTAAIFNAKVVKVDPAATLNNNVPAYRVTVVFDKTDDRIKAGMNANITIVTSSRQNVLTVPQSAIIIKGDDKFVLVDNGSKNPEERKVGLGINGANGEIEIISGLNEGEKIISFGGF